MVRIRYGRFPAVFPSPPLDLIEALLQQALRCDRIRARERLVRLQHAPNPRAVPQRAPLPQQQICLFGAAAGICLVSQQVAQYETMMSVGGVSAHFVRSEATAHVSGSTLQRRTGWLVRCDAALTVGAY